jgi:prepilin-type N-terminal cleavage/methylation domain-containing protein
MTSRITTAIQVRRNRGGDDDGFTLTEMLMAVVVMAVLLAVIVTPLTTLTDTANRTVAASQAAATTTEVVGAMQAGVSSATQICLPTQVTPSASSNPEVVQAGTAVRVLTDAFDSTGANPVWEQWWIDPTTGQLKAQTWAVGTTPPASSLARVVTSNVVPTTGGRLPFAITSEGISAVGAPPAGTYIATGGTADGTSGETGAWTYTLHVYTPTAGTLAQTEPTSGTVSTTAPTPPATVWMTAGSGPTAFSDQLTATGNNGRVTYTQTSHTQPVGTTQHLTTTSGGAVAATGSLIAGPYTAAGTDTDGNGDTGVWSYALNVYTPAANTIVQTAPTSGTVATTGSATFSDQLAVTGNSTTATFTQGTGSASLAISPPPSTTRPKLLTVTLTASTGVKSSAITTPVTASIAALDTAYNPAPGTCLAEVH